MAILKTSSNQLLKLDMSQPHIIPLHTLFHATGSQFEVLISS